VNRLFRTCDERVSTGRGAVAASPLD
jgi:hypothetical protein